VLDFDPAAADARLPDATSQPSGSQAPKAYAPSVIPKTARSEDQNL
jgi:hypothetical protein